MIIQFKVWILKSVRIVSKQLSSTTPDEVNKEMVFLNAKKNYKCGLDTQAVENLKIWFKKFHRELLFFF